PSDATIQHPDGGAAAAVPTAAALPPLAWTGPVTDPAKGMRPAKRSAASVVRRNRAGITPPCRWCEGELAVEGGGEGDRLGRRVVTQRTDEGLAGEVEDAAVGRHHQVA